MNPFRTMHANCTIAATRSSSFLHTGRNWFVVIGAILFGSLAQAQIPDTLKHTLAPPPHIRQYSMLGETVAAGGGFAVAGAPRVYVNEIGAGMVKVFDENT